MIPLGKSSGDHNDVGFKGESSGTKIVFIKFGLLTESINTLNHKSVVLQFIATGKSAKFSGQKSKSKNVVPISHVCGIKGHRRLDVLP